MISWVSVKARNDVTESNPHEETNSRYEYRIRCDYEANIKQLSHLIPTKNPQQWFETKLKFEEILENVNQLTNIEQKKQFTYLIMKNLSYMKEKEGNYQEAFIDAMKALSMSDLTDETALLVRIAYLSLKSNEIWTCQQLISSGHLSKALTPILSDLKEKCRIALLSQPPHPLKTLPSLIPPLLTLKIPIKSFDSVPENSSRLLSILKYFSELQASDIASYSTSGLLDLQYIDESNMVVVGPNVGDNRDISAKEVEFPQNSDNTKSVRKSARHIPRRLREISFDYASIQKGNTTDSMEQTSDFLNWDTLESSVRHRFLSPQ